MSTRKQKIIVIALVVVYILGIGALVYDTVKNIKENVERTAEVNAELELLKHYTCEVVAKRAADQAILNGKYPGRARFDAYAECVSKMDQRRQELRRSR